MGAAGDVGPSITLSPSGCPQPHPVVPRLSPTRGLLSPGCHIVTPPLPPAPSPQPVPHRSPHVQWVLLVEMWGPASHCHHQGVLIPLSPWRPIVPMAPHCPPMGVPKVSRCHQGDPPPPSPQFVPHRAPHVQWVPPVVMWGPVSHCHPWAVPNPTPLSPRRPIVPTMSPPPSAPIIPTMSPPPQPPTCAPQSTPCVMGAQWVPLVVMGCPNHHPLSTPRTPSPPVCPPTHPPYPPHTPLCAPRVDGYAMGAAGGEGVP